MKHISKNGEGFYIVNVYFESDLFRDGYRMKIRFWEFPQITHRPAPVAGCCVRRGSQKRDVHDKQVGLYPVPDPCIDKCTRDAHGGGERGKMIPVKPPGGFNLPFINFNPATGMICRKSEHQ